MYTITFKQSAKRELYALAGKALNRVATGIDNLAVNPRPRGVVKLKGPTKPYGESV